MPFGKSGKQFFNPKVMEAKGDMPEEGHHTVHHFEMAPHGDSPEHPHSMKAHHHDGQEHDLGKHENMDEAVNAAKEHMMGGDMEHGESSTEEEEEPMHNPAMFRKSDTGAY